MPALTSTREGYLQSSIKETGSFLVLACCSGFECGQSGVVLLASAMVTVVTSVTTLWEGVLDLWSGHAHLRPRLWCEPKGVLRICGDSGDGGDAHDSNIRAYSKGGCISIVGSLIPSS
jgi:hypothetical protein